MNYFHNSKSRYYMVTLYYYVKRASRNRRYSYSYMNHCISLYFSIFFSNTLVWDTNYKLSDMSSMNFYLFFHTNSIIRMKMDGVMRSKDCTYGMTHTMNIFVISWNYAHVFCLKYYLNCLYINIKSKALMEIKIQLTGAFWSFPCNMILYQCILSEWNIKLYRGIYLKYVKIN